MQLKTKLLVYITVPIALAVCISSYMTYRTHSAAMRHIIEKDIKATSFFVAENINLTISDKKQFPCCRKIGNHQGITGKHGTTGT